MRVAFAERIPLRHLTGSSSRKFCDSARFGLHAPASLIPRASLDYLFPNWAALTGGPFSSGNGGMSKSSKILGIMGLDRRKIRRRMVSRCESCLPKIVDRVRARLVNRSPIGRRRHVLTNWPLQPSSSNWSSTLVRVQLVDQARVRPIWSLNRREIVTSHRRSVRRRRDHRHCLWADSCDRPRAHARRVRCRPRR